jgi:hypothetical protein
MKVALIFIVLLLILLPLMGVTSTGDGTLKGRLQTFISYGLSLTALLLSLLTIAVSVYSLSSDLDQKQLFMVLTKPIGRYQLILGKLLGVVLLDIALLVLFSGIIYSIAVLTPGYTKASQEELTQVQNELFTARTSHKPEPFNVEKEVLEEYEELIETGEIPPEASRDKKLYDRIINSLTNENLRDKRSAVPGGDIIWHFNDVWVSDEPNQSLFVKFKYDVSVNPPDLKVTGNWLVGDLRQYAMEAEVPFYASERRDLIRTFYELKVPADAVADDGYLGVAFYNDPAINNTVVIFPPDDGLEILFKSDTFTANFIRGVLLILFRLIFLACLGILSSTFLSFPVALLLCLVLFSACSISGFVMESFDTLTESLDKVYYYTIKPFVHLLPEFDKYHPSKYLVPGLLLSWPLLAKIGGMMIGIRSLVLMLAAIIIFSFKEIAKVVI